MIVDNFTFEEIKVLYKTKTIEELHELGLLAMVPGWGRVCTICAPKIVAQNAARGKWAMIDRMLVPLLLLFLLSGCVSAPQTWREVQDHVISTHGITTAVNSPWHKDRRPCPICAPR